MFGVVEVAREDINNLEGLGSILSIGSLALLAYHTGAGIAQDTIADGLGLLLR